MSFWDDLTSVALPVIGAGAGFMIGGPAGAAAGGMIGMGTSNTIAQHENQDYMRRIQQDIFNREDYAVRRRVEDLRAAGMSPVLAAGQGAGTGGIVSTEAPQWDTNTATQAAATMMSFQRMEQDITSAKLANIEAEQRITNNPILIANVGAQTRNLLASAGKTSIEGMQKKADYNLQMASGGTSQPDHVTNFIRNAAGVVSGAFGTNPNQIKHEKNVLRNKVLPKNNKNPQSTFPVTPDYIKLRGGLK